MITVKERICFASNAHSGPGVGEVQKKGSKLIYFLGLVIARIRSCVQTWWVKYHRGRIFL